MKWLIAVALLGLGLVAGPVFLLALLLNQPDDLGSRVTAYRLFALLAGGVLSLAPVSVVAVAVGWRRRAWFLAVLLVLVLPTLALAAGAAWAALVVWG